MGIPFRDYTCPPTKDRIGPIAGSPCIQNFLNCNLCRSDVLTMFAGVKLWQVAIEIWQVATEIQDKISLIVQLGIFPECHPRLKKKTQKDQDTLLFSLLPISFSC